MMAFARADAEARIPKGDVPGAGVQVVELKNEMPVLGRA